jgi:HAD superfamily hydrolase (TIGR01549 family)
LSTVKKIVSFDLDGTIVHGRYGDAVWNQGIPEQFAERHSVTLEQAKRFIRAEYQAVGEGHIDWYDIDYWLKRFDLPVAARGLVDRYESFIELVPHAREVIETLKARYTLIIASNAPRIFVEKELHYTGLARHFTHIISATTDYGIVKKGEGFYERLCAALNVSPHEMAHVGDHPVFDFEAPSRIGIEAYYLCREEPPNGPVKFHPNGHRVIRSLRELIDRL